MLTGKGFFISEIAQCEGGNLQAIAEQAHQAGLSYVVVKIAEGTTPANSATAPAHNPIQALRKYLTQHAIRLWGWQRVFGADPVSEGHLAQQIISHQKLDGLAVVVAAEYKQPGGDANARLYMHELRGAHPQLPIALSSYRYPSYHKDFPWEAFLTFCTYNMPLVFWVQAHNPHTQLMRSFQEFDSLRPFRPVIPVGAVFSTDVWQPTPSDVQEFLDTAQSLNLSAISFWDWDSTSGGLSSLWQPIQNTPWTLSELPADVVGEYIAALNTHDAQTVSALYAARCVHVNAARTLAGKTAIQNWYAGWFADGRSALAFDLMNYQGAGNVRHFKWRAAPAPDVSAASAAGGAQPHEGYLQLFQGVFYRKQHNLTPREHTTHIALIDLDNPDIDLIVTPRAGLGSTTSDFLGRYNLQLAINGDEWLSLTDPKGLAVAEGDQYSPASPEPTVYISHNHQIQIGGLLPPNLWDAISGSHTLVQNGLISAKILSCAKPEYCEIKTPRTAIGKTTDNQLVLVVVQGPPLDLRNALTLKELAGLFVSLGARDAICFDGGGSSTLAVEQSGVASVFNVPSDGRERVVANHLGVRAKKLLSDTVKPSEEGNDTFGLLNGEIVYHLAMTA